MHFDGILVLVDRVDEPYLINGSTDLMRALVWPMLDNKFLKHPGLGLKLLLPIELERLVDRESRDFHQRARLDKQNLIRSLGWTGQSLYDMANARIAACAAEGSSPKITELFEGVDERRLMDAFGHAARAAAPVQVHVPPVHHPLQRPHRGAAGLEDLQRRRSSRCWRSTSAIKTPSTAAWGRGKCKCTPHAPREVGSGASYSSRSA